MLTKLGRLALQSKVRGTSAGPQVIRCSVCQEALSICKGQHGPAQQQTIPAGDVADLTYHKPDCQYPDESCYCKTGEAWAV